jgi:hypothetical protein
MGVLNRMIKKKGSNTKGKSAATCKNEKKTGKGPIDSFKCVLCIISITWVNLVFVVCRISVLTGLYFLTTGGLEPVRAINCSV